MASPTSSSSSVDSSVGPSTTAECPICHELVLVRIINSHVDECLKKENSLSSRKRQSSPASLCTRKAKVQRAGFKPERNAKARYNFLDSIHNTLRLILMIS